METGAYVKEAEKVESGSNLGGCRGPARQTGMEQRSQQEAVREAQKGLNTTEISA